MPAPGDSRTNARVFGLDLLRAAAIVLVLAAHTWPSPSANPWGGASAVLGVELFFVLSGFLIGGILLRMADAGTLATWAGLTRFWRRRWYRTLPNYYLFLGLRLAWRAWVLGYPAVLTTNWDYLFFVQNLTQQPSYFFFDSWSLAVEEWFYLLFALFLWAALGLGRNTNRIWLAVTGFFLLAPVLLRLWLAVKIAAASPELTSADWRDLWNGFFRTSVLVRLDVVMYGVLAAFVASRYPQCWRQLARCWWCGLGLIVIATTSQGLNWPLDRGHVAQGLLLWPCMAIGFALLLPRCSLMVASSGLFANVIRLLAMWSYALYLCHGLVILVLRQFFGPKSALPLALHSWSWCLTVWVLSLLVAAANYRWFEKPIMDLRERRRPGSQQPG